ncbi:hypothetical protein TsocGM_20015 [Tautonia sociabilis]|uniref:CehA/McbA family metallohydrolase n=1 Tax=Tautonia sociabilis TaxID=2080755 RepID=A0A432MF85_9BACT|nr:hypothetical protein TsocGM_20015 [Tautonia sociabilis]
MLFPAAATGSDLPTVPNVPRQPLAAQARRVVEALEMIGRPLPEADLKRLEDAYVLDDEFQASLAIQEIFDPYCLVGVSINPESRVKAQQGPAAPSLMQQGWRAFLVKVHNEAGVTAPLRVSSPNAAPIYSRSTGSPDPPQTIVPETIPDRWVELSMFDDRPLNPTLSGLPLEYRILQIHSRDAGPREAKLTFDVGQGTQDLGFRSDVDILFRCEPGVVVSFDVRDEDGSPVMGSFLIRDHLGRVYPSPGRRLAPDFFFHPQIYRRTGESVILPPGTFTVESTRGPEYRIKSKTIIVEEGAGTQTETFELERWADLAAMGWYSGDHHVHAAGCAHYESPSEGVQPEHMMRHILGEDLVVGCVLSWGPCWYYQKQFFDGRVHPLSTPDYLMRYDVEVSGFPSSHAGHLCLLRLTEDDYPGTTLIEEWPSWDLPVLQWGKSQGAVVGFSHSGWGLQTQSKELPNFEMPPFDGIGANEYIVDVVHDAVDFISSVDTPAPYELNIWYHTLNCGYRCRISGETDFPCIYGERVGLGRSYVKVDGDLDYDRWVQGIKDGRSYVGDGRSHLVDFQVADVAVGENGSELALDRPGQVRVSVRAAALLEPEPNERTEAIRNRPLDQKPYWDIERARVGNSRKVPVEVVVNGLPVARQEIEADGQFNDLSFEVPIERSSWVALRIYPSSHTNPIFVTVAGAPIRASRRSAEWCLKAVDQCWSQKVRNIRPEERDAAEAAYDVAREAYQKILAESDVE